MKKTKSKGFTLIEILVVIGLIAILAAIVLIAINPARQFAQARNTQRTSDISAISNAIGQYMADNKGDTPSSITSSDLEIRKASGGADLCDDLVPTYMAAFPVDPQLSDPAAITDCTSTYVTHYNVKQDSSTNRITVSAPDTEPPATEDASITR